VNLSIKSATISVFLMATGCRCVDCSRYFNLGNSKEVLIGKVRQVTDTIYQMTKKEERMTSCSIYDTNGNVVFAYSNNERGEGSVDTEMNIYDQRGKLKMSTTVSGYNTPTDVLTKRRFVYDTLNGSCILFDDHLVYKSVNSYDGAGRLASTNTFQYRELVVADEYDTVGNRVKCTDHGFGVTSYYKYDKRNNMIRETRENHCIYTCWVTKRYDTLQRVTEAREYGFLGQLVCKVTHGYNEMGYERERKEYDETGSLVSDLHYSYQYDASGNWTMRSIRQGKKELEHTVRKITYY
jgi:hypothetical protein